VSLSSRFLAFYDWAPSLVTFGYFPLNEKRVDHPIKKKNSFKRSLLVGALRSHCKGNKEKGRLQTSPPNMALTTTKSNSN
jgi:hypothetical protein